MYIAVTDGIDSFNSVYIIIRIVWLSSQRHFEINFVVQWITSVSYKNEDVYL